MKSHTSAQTKTKAVALKATKTSKDNCCQAVKYCVFKVLFIKWHEIDKRNICLEEYLQTCEEVITVYLNSTTTRRANTEEFQ